MPYETGQDIGGFGRLAEAQRWVKGQERLDVKEAQNTKLFELQVAATQNNLGEIERGRTFKQQYMQALTSAKPGEHYQAGQDYLAKYATENPDNADLAYTAMQELDARQSDILDDIRKENPKASLALFNKTIGRKMGIVAEGAGADIEKGDLFEMFSADSGESLGVFYNDPATNHPTLYSKDTLKKPEGKKDGVLVKGENDLRKEFSALPETKTYTEVSRQVGILGKAMEEVRGTAGQPDESRNLIAVDQALITLFNKMMDPTSVVRESEYARTPGDMAMMSRAKGAVAKVVEGGAGLTDPEREAIFEMANKFSRVAGQKYSAQADFYTGLAERRGYDTENIIRITPPDASTWEEPGAQSQIMTVDYEGMDVQAKLAPDGFYYVRRGDKFLKYTPGGKENQDFGVRADGSKKGTGFLGVLRRPGGGVSTEISIGVELDGKEMTIPTLVPTLSQKEIDYLLGGGDPTEEIVRKAVVHAQGRIRDGESVFAE